MVDHNKPKKNLPHSTDNCKQRPHKTMFIFWVLALYNRFKYTFASTQHKLLRKNCTFYYKSRWKIVRGRKLANKRQMIINNWWTSVTSDSVESRPSWCIMWSWITPSSGL